MPRTDDVPDRPRSKDTTPIVKREETVLLVEDEPSLLKMTTSMLQRQGHKVLAVDDGARAIALSKSYQGAIDLLITDVVMPNMNGAELAKTFHALRPQSRILYTSGYPDMAILDQGTVPKYFVFLEKPFSAAMLAAKVREALSLDPENGE